MNARTNFADDYQVSNQEPIDQLAQHDRESASARINTGKIGNHLPYGGAGVPNVTDRLNMEQPGGIESGIDNTPEPVVQGRPQLPLGESDKYFVFTWTNPQTKANKYYIKALPQFLATATAVAKNRWDRAAIKYLACKGDTTEKTLVKVLISSTREQAENLEQVNPRETMAFARSFEERIGYLSFLIASSEMELTSWAARERDRDRNASDNPSYLKKLQFRIDCARDLAILGAVMQEVFPEAYSKLDLDKKLKRAIYNQQDQLTRKYCNAEVGPVVANKAELSEADQAELDAA